MMKLLKKQKLLLKKSSKEKHLNKFIYFTRFFISYHGIIESCYYLLFNIEYNKNICCRIESQTTNQQKIILIIDNII